ncbi:MAG: ABC transporter permease [Luteibacter sp.]
MFFYYFQLGVRSLRRNPVLTALMVLAIGFGVGASMTTYAVFRATSNDPLPDKSSKLFLPQIDNWGPTAKENKGEPPQALSYVDTMALMRAHRARHQTAIYPIGVTIIPADASVLPFQEVSYASYGDAFPMFDVPFLYGSGWPPSADESHAAVAVIGRELNQKLFGGANSVGREINLGGRSYRISGVMDEWKPQPMFFDAANSNGFSEPTQLFIPFTRAIDMKMTTTGNSICDKSPGNDWDALLHSECAWIAYWVELPDEASVADYRSYLRDYASEQQRAGRFKWAPNIRLRDVMQWLDYLGVVPPESRISLMVALSFLLICLVNTVGLLLAKFMRRAPEVGVRRALGATRKSIYMQFLIEAAIIGLAGGLLGLALTGLGTLGIDLVFDPGIARLATFDTSLVGLTLLLSIVATVLAALYPVWRAAQVQPAWQLKIH